MMNKKDKNLNEYYTIDILHIVKTIWSKAWVIVLSAIIVAALAFSYAKFLITPQYSSSILLYVNNSSVSIGNASFSITSSEITAAQSLVKTYTVMLKNRTTLQEVIDKTGVKYSWEELYSMISASAVNETEVLMVTVTTPDPYEAEKIANCISEVLPQRISHIIEGSSMKAVDTAVVNLRKVSPSITNYTAVGLVLGIVLSLVVLVIIALLDDKIHDEEYILRSYDYPILAKIPDLMNAESKSYGYYYKRRSTTTTDAK